MDSKAARSGAGDDGRPRARPFVLLHGGAHGGWCFRDVARLLRDRGHDVYTPTLTGYGERVHLLTADITIDTHVTDVTNVLDYEDLTDVVLVGHSLGGTIIPRIAAARPARVSHLVWLAAMVLDDGETALETVVPDDLSPQQHDPTTGRTVDGIVTRFMHDGTAEQQKWLEARISAMPTAALLAPGELSPFRDTGIPATYIRARDDRMITADQFRRFVDKLPETSVISLDGSHNVMMSRPAEVAVVLLDIAASHTTPATKE